MIIKTYEIYFIIILIFEKYFLIKINIKYTTKRKKYYIYNKKYYLSYLIQIK